jgi:small subunit ribosomal protein S10
MKDIRIKLKSYDHRLLDQSVKKLIEIARANGSEVKGPVPLPTNKEIFTILRSPHVDKSSREQFERRTHKRLLILSKPTPQSLDALQRIIIPVGVEIQIKL